jgi:hypothetical protein
VKTKLKPAYKTIEAREIRVGDTIYGGEIERDSKVTKIGISRDGCPVVYPHFGLRGHFEPMLRKLPDREHPEVLMRALRISITEDLLCEDFRDGYMHGHPDKERREAEIATRVNKAIDAALKEIESEGAK